MCKSSLLAKLVSTYAICVTTCVKDTSSGLEGLFNFQVHEAEELWWKKKYICDKFIPNIFPTTLNMNKY